MSEGTLVLGLGSPLMGDDGLGLAALERLRAAWLFEPEVRFMDGGTWGMNLLGDIEDAARLLVLDAIHAGSRAGEVVVLQGEALPRYLFTKVSPHQVDIREVLALAEFRGTLPPDTVAVGLQPARVELSTELSPAVQAGMDRLLDTAVGWLEAWGHVASPRHGDPDRPVEGPAPSPVPEKKVRTRGGRFPRATS